MKLKYEAPEIDIFKFSLSTQVFAATASNTDEDIFVDNTTAPKFTVPDEIDPLA